jgi:hypothetical protein
MRIASVIAATALVALIPLAVSAGEVENRIHNENARIDQGIRNGSLTYREDRSVDNHLNSIQAQRNRDLRRDGGHLTAGQYAHLNHEENSLSNRIYFDKHNESRQ